MAAIIRKNPTFLIFKHASNKNVDFCISPVSASLSLHFFSTQSLNPNTNPTVYDILVQKHNFPCEFASRVASKLPRAKNPKKLDSMLTFLKSSGFSTSHLQKIIRYRPSFLCFSLDRNIKPKIKTFQEEGFPPTDISMIISCYLKILEQSLNNSIVPSFALIHDLLGSNAAVITAVRKSPGLLASNLRKTLEPNLEFLMRNGVSADRIRVVFNAGYPHIFICKPEIMRGAVEKIIEMGLNVSSKAFIYGILTFVFVKNKGLEALKDVGFSETDIMSMFRKEPRVFVVSAEKLRKVVEGLVGTGKFGISSIVHLPVALFCSFEKRYKPRITILRILESRNLVEDWPPLYVLSMATEAKFAERFVRPYINEIRDAFIEKMKVKHLLL